MVERRVTTLPIEIQEHIISSLNNEEDAGTIANCALVCRQWLPRSRSKLYSLIPLGTRRQCTSFRSLVQHPPLSIAAYLKNVQELYIWPDREEKLEWKAGQERPWAHNILTQFAGYLPDLTRVEFHYVYWRRAHDFSLRIGCTYHSITTLVLKDCTFASVSQLHTLATAFPALSDLTLVLITLRSKEPLSITRKGHPLTRLELSYIDNDVTVAITQWLDNAQMVQNLADLDWSCTSEDGWKTLVEAIDGRSLRKLEVWVDEHWPGLAYIRLGEMLGADF